MYNLYYKCMFLICILTFISLYISLCITASRTGGNGIYAASNDARTLSVNI